MTLLLSALLLCAPAPSQADAAPLSAAAPADPDFASLSLDEAGLRFNNWTLDLSRRIVEKDARSIDAAVDRIFAAYELLSKRFPERQPRWDDDLIQSVAGFSWTRLEPIVRRRLEQMKANNEKAQWSAAGQAWREHAWDGKDAVFAGPLLGGGEVDVAKDYKGKWTLVQVWDMGCGPCVREIPHIQAMVKKMGDKAPQVIGVCLDADFRRDEVAPFLAQRKVAWPQIFDGKGFRGKICTDYKIRSIPTVFLVNPEAKIAGLIQQDTFDWAVERHIKHYEERKAAIKP
ncbi:MAG: Thiol-disulfide oxidoreductase ResA [Verrucomicrobiota bacterium]|jgi:thiol-disulfide isomerase/thioredoxin